MLNSIAAELALCGFFGQHSTEARADVTVRSRRLRCVRTRLSMQSDCRQHAGLPSLHRHVSVRLE